jgi:predicted DNA-binding protein
VYYIGFVTTITCRIPEKLDAELEALALRRRVPKSQIIRESIESSLNGKKALKVSAYDVMKSVCGIVRSGHKDLSTNPKHMKGFGRD